MIVRNIVGRLHVSATNREVIREVRGAIKKEYRKSRAFRKERHDIYRQAIREHKRNRELYLLVMGSI